MAIGSLCSLLAYIWVLVGFVILGSHFHNGLHASLLGYSPVSVFGVGGIQLKVMENRFIKSPAL